MTQSILSQIGGKAKTVTVVFDEGLEFDFVANDHNYKKLAEARNELKAVHATMTEAEEDEAQNLDKLKVMIDKGMTETFGEDAAAKVYDATGGSTLLYCKAYIFAMEQIGNVYTEQKNLQAVSKHLK